MKFRKIDNCYQIKIKNEWYDLCACDNCKRVHATHQNIGVSSLLIADKKIRCCDNPDNHIVLGGANKIIKSFVENIQGLNQNDTSTKTIRRINRKRI